MSRLMREADRVQTWVEVEVVTDPGDPGPIGMDLYLGSPGMGRFLAHLSREVVDADGARHYWKRVR